VAELNFGWKFVIEQQRFLLSDPGLYVPAIEAALDGVTKKGVRAARGLFEIAAPAVRVKLSADWESFFALLDGHQPKSD
jgi:hypothetical protein